MVIPDLLTPGKALNPWIKPIYNHILRGTSSSKKLSFNIPLLSKIPVRIKKIPIIIGTAYSIELIICETVKYKGIPTIYDKAKVGMIYLKYFLFIIS
jgi:hypothetical protein